MIKKYSSFLGPYFQAYLELRQKLGYTSFTRDFLARDFDYFVLFFSKTTVKDITEGDILYWMHFNTKLSAATKNNRLGFIRGFFDYLIRIGVTQHNPTSSIRYVKTKTFRPHHYSLQELHQILQEAIQHPGPMGQTLHALFLLLYACGLRINEALRLEIRDVDFEQNLLVLRNTKFHKERLVPFSKLMASRLKSYLAFRLKTFSDLNPNASFFCHIHGRLCYGYVQTVFRRIVRRCGIANPRGLSPRLHDLRHTFAVHRLYKWYQDGGDILNKLPILSTYMGHVSIENTKTYLAVTQPLLREADKRFQKSFEGLVKKTPRRRFKPS